MSSVLDDKQAPPDDAALTAALGRKKKLWDDLVAFVEAEADGVALEWKFYGKKHGWQLKALRKRRALLYLIPHAGSFLAGMALGDDAVEAVRSSRLPATLIEEIATAKPYPEGRPARVEVTTKKTADLVMQLVRIKLSST